MPNPTPASILARIRKLSAMTVANGCSETEAAFAMQKLNEIMAEYNPTEQELRAEATRCEGQVLRTMDKDYRDWWKILTPIAKLWGCHSWHHCHIEDLFGLGQPQVFNEFHFFGIPTDATAAMSMTAMCFSAIQTEASAWTKLQRKCAKSSERNELLRSFRVGMADRLQERIIAMIPLRPEMSTGQGLVVLKDQLVNAEFAKLGLKLHYGSTATREVDPRAYAAGQAAASNVNISPGQSVGRAPLAVGRG